MSRRRPFEPHASFGLHLAVALAAIGLLVLSPGCGPKPTTQPADSVATSQPASNPAGGPKTSDDSADLSRVPGRSYIVQQGDTLYNLAERYYGHSKHWRKIWTANRNRLANPNDLPVGMKLIIPP